MNNFDEPCIYCDRPLDPQASGTYAELDHGWAQRRADGGPHGVTEPHYTGRLACRNCMDLRRRGIHPGQKALL